MTSQRVAVHSAALMQGKTLEMLSGAPLQSVKRMETQTTIVPGPPGPNGEPTFQTRTVQVPVVYVGGAKVQYTDQNCALVFTTPLRRAAVIHVIDSVLLPPPWDVLARPGPFEVTAQTAIVPRRVGSPFQPVRVVAADDGMLGARSASPSNSSWAGMLDGREYIADVFQVATTPMEAAGNWTGASGVRASSDVGDHQQEEGGPHSYDDGLTRRCVKPSYACPAAFFLFLGQLVSDSLLIVEI